MPKYKPYPGESNKKFHERQKKEGIKPGSKAPPKKPKMKKKH